MFRMSRKIGMREWLESARVVRFTAIAAILLCLPAGQTAHAQPNDPQFERLTTLDGLSQDIITCVFRDQLGFLWIGTEDGLNRYDGYSIKSYKHRSGDTTTIRSNWILGVTDFQDEDLLIATRQGLSVYHRATDSFLPPSGVIADLPEVGYRHLLRDKGRGYWLLRENSAIIRCSPDLTEYRLFEVSTTGATDGPQSLSDFILDLRGRIVVATNSGLIFLDTNLQLLESITLTDAQLPGAKLPAISTLTEDAVGVFWLGTESGLYNYDEQSDRLAFVPLGEPRERSRSDSHAGRDLIFDLVWDRSGRLWISGFIGLYCYSPRTGRAFHYPSVRNDPERRTTSRIYALLADSADLLWVGTWGEGLARIDLHRERFGLVRHSRRTSFAGGGSAIAAIYVDPEGTVWLGSEEHGVTLVKGGMASMNGAMTSFKSWYPPGMSKGSVGAITGDSSGNVWIAAERDEVTSYNIFTRSLRRIPLPPTRERKKILSILVDPTGPLWLGTDGHGVYRYDPWRESFQTFGEDATNPAHRSLRSAWSFHADREGVTYIGGWVGNAGLHRYDPKTATLTSFEQPQLAAARAILDDGAGGLWVGTWGNGLTRFDPASGTLRNYAEADGLPSNYVKSILSDADGRLWIATERGLSRFDPGTGTFQNFDVTDGLQSNFFLSGSCFKDKTGRLYFGGPGGVNAFFPDSIADAPYDAPVHLTSFRVFDKPKLFDRSMSLVSTVELDHDENLFSFEYISLDYRSPSRNQYAYMMEGVDPDWIQAGTRRYVSYTHLDPGDYVFSVKGTNSDGVWSTNVASVRVSILPAFWQTWWFRAALVIAVAASLYVAYRYRLNKLLEVERTRAAIARDLHDDIGTSLTNIALFSDLARRDVAAGSAEAAGRLQRIADTSRSLLDSMNDIVWSIKPENDALERTILRMEDYAVDVLEENGIDLHVRIPEQIRNLKLPMTVRRNLFLVFKEAIGNVLKHARATEVDVTIAAGTSGRRPAELIVTIADNGRGFDPSAQNGGNGIKNIDLRTRQMGGEVRIVSAGGQGTRVEVRFPLKSAI